VTGLRIIARLAGRLWSDARGLGAVEFAITAPFLILLYVGSFQLMDVISCYRKVSITTHTLADLITRQSKTTPDEVDQTLQAARQVMTPYSTANATLIITEVHIDHSGVQHVVWSRSNDGTDVTNADLDVPESIKIPDTYLILSQIIYRYEPAVAGSLIGAMTFRDHIYMNPRISDSICLNTGTPEAPVCADEETA
jgi:Flp pilus assembly protein TadG